MTTNPYTLKAFKFMPSLSEETLCFTATLALGTQRIAEVSNRGNGGCNEVRVLNTFQWGAFEYYAKNLPPQISESFTNDDGSPFSYEMDAEALITLMAADLAQAEDDKKEAKRWAKACQTATLFRKEGDDPGAWSSVSFPKPTKRPLTPEEFKSWAERKGYKVAIVLNEAIKTNPMAWRL